MRFYNKYRNGIYTESQVSMPVIAKFGTGGGNTPLVMQKVTGTLNPGGHPGSYNGQDAYNDLLVVEDHEMPMGRNANMPHTVCEKCGGGQRMPDKMNFNAVLDDEQNTNMIVRRLTPTECLRLQGFPDSWLDLGDWTDSKGKKHKEADGPRYKALGNSIAVGYANGQSGFWCWLARRICAQYERQITMASLFDGIGGFPLAFQAAGAIPVWASEIEEFPIAVTKIRFPEEEKGD